VLGAETNSNEPRGHPLQPRPGIDQSKRERRLEFLIFSADDWSKDAVLDLDLHRLGHFCRPQSAMLYRFKVILVKILLG